jgi:hypothetical protein
MEGKAGLRIAYSNQKIKMQFAPKNYKESFHRCRDKVFV